MAQFTKYTGTLSGQNGTLITALDAALVTGQGWDNTLAGGGANKRCYRPPAGNQFYLRVRDDGPDVGGAKEARICGYEAMTDVDTGTHLFPAAAQMADGLYVRKSATADGVARTYQIWADDRTFYMFILTGDTAGMYYGWGFGDFYSLVASDGYRTMIRGWGAANNTTQTYSGMDLISANVTLTTIANYMARGHTGLAGSVNFGVHGDSAKSTSGTLFGSVPFTNPSNGGLYIAPVWIHDPTTAPANGLRGRLRGFWQFLHAIASITDGDTFTGTGDLAGKTFVVLKQSRNAGVYIIETSNTLETN